MWGRGSWEGLGLWEVPTLEKAWESLKWYVLFNLNDPKGARHVAADIAGMNRANPIALIESSVMMLKYLKMNSYADRIENAVKNVLTVRKVWTPDLGGTA